MGGVGGVSRSRGVFFTSGMVAQEGRLTTAFNITY